jgi:hypothetical protein
MAARVAGLPLKEAAEAAYSTSVVLEWLTRKRAPPE